MAEKLKYKVLRGHDGDRFYNEGEERVGTKAELGHLVPNVLELIGPVAFDGKGDHDGNGETGGAAEPITTPAKAEPAPLNKAETAAPANKAASSRASKRK